MYLKTMSEGILRGFELLSWYSVLSHLGHTQPPIPLPKGGVVDWMSLC